MLLVKFSVPVHVDERQPEAFFRATDVSMKCIDSNAQDLHAQHVSQNHHQGHGVSGLVSFPSVLIFPRHRDIEAFRQGPSEESVYFLSFVRQACAEAETSAQA